jgi:serine/arginine repetitive matrix protein 2
VYTSLRDEPLVHARLSTGGRTEQKITFKRPLPTRLTYRVQSDPIIVRLSAADPQFRLEVFGAGLSIEPSILDFSRSPEASFRITGNSLGPKTITFVRAGPNATVFGGLPVTSDLVVERAFMRNTFQLAFVDHEDEKRRYMFSVDDPLLRHQWIVSLKRQVEIASARQASDPSVDGRSAFHRATESMALRVLQQTLIEPIATPERRLPNMTSVDAALQRVANETARAERDEQNAWNSDSQRKRQRASLHARSKSRSKVYHRHGPGKLEPQSENGSVNSSGRTPAGSTPGDAPSTEERSAKVWSGRALENICQRNSSIALVLAYLQVGSPDHESFRWSAGLK